MDNINFEVFGAFGATLAVLIYFISYIKEEKKLEGDNLRNEITRLHQDLKDERKDHDNFVEKVGEALIFFKNQRNGTREN